MRISDHSDHSLNCHNQSVNRSVIYSMETFCNEDCPPTTLTGNITYHTKYNGWKKLVRYNVLFYYSALRKNDNDNMFDSALCSDENTFDINLFRYC